MTAGAGVRVLVARRRGSAARDAYCPLIREPCLNV
jgi:hypothetical protein